MRQSANRTINNVTDGLLMVEKELRQLGYWEHERPPEHALQSQQPFCVDTLVFTQWLQFIFLPGMKARVEQERSLPAISGIAPMAEEFFRKEPVTGESLIATLRQMDALLSRH